MKVYKICDVEYFELTEEDFLPPCDDRRRCSSECPGEGYYGYTEWFWDFYGSEVWDDCEEVIEDWVL